MATLNDLRDQIFAAAGRLTGSYPTMSQQSALVDAYNEAGGPPYARARHALEAVLDVKLDDRELVQKSASVDRVNLAIQNLKRVKAKGK